MIKSLVAILLVGMLFAQAPNPPTGLVATSGPLTDGPAELPRTTVNSSVANTPTPGAKTVVTANLQTAINNANCGDQLLLAPGVVFSGKITLPNKSCDSNHWIQIRSQASDANLPPEGTRMLPCYSGILSLPGRPAFTCPSSTVETAQIIYNSTTGSGPIALAAGANHYRIGPGLEITANPGAGSVFDLIAGGLNTNNIVVDRNWIHGTAQGEVVVGINLSNMQTVAVVDNYFSDTHCISVTGSCRDSHAVAGGLDSVQAGPFKVQNNFLESAGQGILFGGGPATFTPADITIARNHFFKPMTWLKGQPNYVGGTNGNPFVVKNHLEFKNGQRVLAEGNIFEDVWGGFTQAGWSILLTPKSQAVSITPPVSECPLCMVQDITIRYSTISHSGSGIALDDAPSDAGGCAQAGQRWSIHDITDDDISVSKYAGNGTGFQIESLCAGATPPEILNSIAINHVTVFEDAGTHDMSVGGSPTAGLTMYGFTVQNSIMGSAKYPVWSTGGGGTNCAISSVPLTVFNACFPLGYTFTHNAFIFPQGPNTITGYWPMGNYFPANVSAVMFANYNNGIGGDYTLLPASPYKNAGQDGKDLGADISAIKAATAGVY